MAVERTTLEITRLYDAVEGVMVGVVSFHEVYKMDANELRNTRIGYLGMDPKQ